MAAPSLTYTLSNGTTADADQVMQNLNDLLNGITDGAKDITINALTANGPVTFNGNVTLGNGSVDDVTITGSLAASIAIKTDGTFDIGSATAGLRAIYLGDSTGKTTKIFGGAPAADIVITAPSYTTNLGLNDLTEDTTPLPADPISTYDVSAGTDKKVFAGAMTRDVCWNLGVTYSSSTFTVCGEDGTALSATNPAWVTIPSKTAGKLKRLRITANSSFVDSTGSSTIINNLFGMTTGVAWGASAPYYIYVVIKDSEDAAAVMISRLPHLLISPAAAAIGQSGSAIADPEISMFAMSAITATDYDANPCTCVGSFRMTKNTSDDHAVTALTAGVDGIGRFQEETRFTMPLAQKGAATGCHFLDNGGTAPLLTTGVTYQYMVRRNGMCHGMYFYSGTPSATGLGAVALTLSQPFTEETSSRAGHGVAHVGANAYNDIAVVFQGVGGIRFFRSISNLNVLNTAYTTAGGANLQSTFDFPIAN